MVVSEYGGPSKYGGLDASIPRDLMAIALINEFDQQDGRLFSTTHAKERIQSIEGYFRDLGVGTVGGDKGAREGRGGFYPFFHFT
jgi:hypothetical protein